MIYCVKSASFVNCAERFDNLALILPKAFERDFPYFLAPYVPL